jgi:hypothetical protein
MLDGTVVRASRFVDDAGDRGGGKPADQGLISGLVVAETPGFSARKPMHIEVIFRDIHAKVEGVIFSAPLLVIRAISALVSVQAIGKDELAGC